MAKDLTKAQIERLELYNIRYPWNPQDILRLLDEQQAAYDGLYKEWRVKNEACNKAYAITIPRQEKRIAELEAKVAKLEAKIERDICWGGPEACKKHREKFKTEIEEARDRARIIENLRVDDLKTYHAVFKSINDTAERMLKAKDDRIAKLMEQNIVRAWGGDDEPDLDTCPGCGGPADNGNDRCVPPGPYLCTKCSASELS